jgi:hypothetical protein
VRLESKYSAMGSTQGGSKKREITPMCTDVHDDISLSYYLHNDGGRGRFIFTPEERARTAGVLFGVGVHFQSIDSGAGNAIF